MFIVEKLRRNVSINKNHRFEISPSEGKQGKGYNKPSPARQRVLFLREAIVLDVDTVN